MKKFCRWFCALMFLAVASPAMAQEPKKPAAAKKPAGANQRAVNSPLLKAVEGLELTADQKAKVKVIGKEFTETMQGLRKKGLNQSLTKQRTEAVKKAREAGKKGVNLADEVLATMSITDEQKAVLKQASEAQAKLQEGLAAVLTKEQIAALPQQMKATLTRAANRAKKSA